MTAWIFLITSRSEENSNHAASVKLLAELVAFFFQLLDCGEYLEYFRVGFHAGEFSPEADSLYPLDFSVGGIPFTASAIPFESELFLLCNQFLDPVDDRVPRRGWHPKGFGYLLEFFGVFGSTSTRIIAFVPQFADDCNNVIVASLPHDAMLSRGQP